MKVWAVLELQKLLNLLVCVLNLVFSVSTFSLYVDTSHVRLKANFILLFNLINLLILPNFTG